ncbi:MAG: alpha/beta hydrolase [Bacteroidota bacterium]
MEGSCKNYHIKTQHGRINYYVLGKGPKVMLCFHGYGQDASAMIPLASIMSEDYTSYCFDLFHHGKSFWSSKEHAIEKSFWVEVLTQFLSEQNIKTFSITAFSLGGKLALVTTEYFISQIDELILLAPDGIKTQRWYNLATYPGVFKNFFKSVIIKPHRFYRVVNTLNHMGVLDKGIKKFAFKEMSTLRQRRLMYYSWVAFRNLSTDSGKIIRLLNEANTKVTMYLGHYDKIITQEGVAKFTDNLDSIDLVLLNSGHNSLVAELVNHLQSNASLPKG